VPIAGPRGGPAGPKASAPAPLPPRGLPFLTSAALAGTLLLSLLFRLGWAAAIEADPQGTFRWDSTWYQHNAAHFWQQLGTTRIPDLEPVGEGPQGAGSAWSAYWPPGYAAVLGAVYLLAGGPDLRAAEVFQALLGAGTVLLVYLAASSLMGRGVGLAAALVLALFPGHALYAPLVMTEALASFLLAALLLAMVALARCQGPPPCGRPWAWGCWWAAAAWCGASSCPWAWSAWGCWRCATGPEGRLPCG
jgi:hypothetical protein